MAICIRTPAVPFPALLLFQQEVDLSSFPRFHKLSLPLCVSSQAELAALGISKGGQGRRGDDGDNLDSGNVGSMLRRQFSRQASVRKAQGSLPGMDDSDGEDDSPSRGPGSSHTGE